MSRERSPEERALDRLVIELRDLPSPELDWDRVEARLLAEPRAAQAPSWFARLRLPALTLAAAGVAAYLLVPRHPKVNTQVPAPVAQIPKGPINGDQLAIGTHVSAGNQDVVVEHTGRARWTLEPHATASVTDAGEFLTVRLESGALSASVTPQHKAETFAVEVGGTRVAVHGTAFRVERVGDRVSVEVTEGVVAVEPASTHSDPSFLLRRGSRGSFGLDGRTGSVEGNASVVLHETTGKSHREIASTAALRTAKPQASSGPSMLAAPDAPASANVTAPVEAAPAPAALPEQPSISDIESGVSTAVQLMNQCFRDKTQSTSIVSVSTGMTLSIAGDGSVQSVTFEPPLAPAVEDCGVAGLRNLAFAHSIEGATFTRILELKR